MTTQAATQPQQGERAIAQERVLVIDREFQAPRDEVFRAWTDPNRVVEWWGPDGFSVPDSSFDVRVGGAWRTKMRSPDGNEFTVSGVYREITEPSRLVMTWGWEEDGKRGHETELTVELTAIGDHTAMHFEQRVFESSDVRDRHEHGWTSSFDSLKKALG